MFIVHLTIYNFMVRALSTQEARIQNIDQTISHSYEEKKLASASRLSKQKNNYSACWNSKVYRYIHTKTLTYNTFFKNNNKLFGIFVVKLIHDFEWDFYQYWCSDTTRMRHHFWLCANKKKQIFIYSRNIFRISDGLKFELKICLSL